MIKENKMYAHEISVQHNEKGITEPLLCTQPIQIK